MKNIGITQRFISLWFVAFALLGTLGNVAGAVPEELRICSDPGNLPFSNQQLQGFENKIADLIASEMGMRAAHYWWPAQRGMVRSFLNTGRCDVLIGVPTGYDRVTFTKPYYRTSYVIAYDQTRDFSIDSLDDDILKTLKIGVHVNTPPHGALARRGIMGNQVKAYPLFFDSQYSVEDYPGRVVEELLAKKIDVAIIWGPIAGYFVKKHAAPLAMIPLEGIENRIPFTFKISMGVRKRENELKAKLEAALQRKQPEIQQVLEDYGVPLLPLN
ncbi:substrate-binding domain-containing protein [Candidatus Entotheonella palauensis]|nr:substrate-binding domain-containing protein [Candidatus Entotheonella palauensis]